MENSICNGKAYHSGGLGGVASKKGMTQYVNLDVMGSGVRWNLNLILIFFVRNCIQLSQPASCAILLVIWVCLCECICIYLLKQINFDLCRRYQIFDGHLYREKGKESVPSTPSPHCLSIAIISVDWFFINKKTIIFFAMPTTIT